MPPPRFEQRDADLGIASGRGLEKAVVRSADIGALNSWLRNRPEEIVSAIFASLRDELQAYADGMSVRLPGAMWLISSAPA
jgi:hypothetical protein